MHAALEGVILKNDEKLLVFNIKKRNGFLNDYKEQINIRLKSIRPPHNFRSSPCSIEDLLHWKAADFHSFLLFYSLPVLKDILPSDYFFF